MSSANLDPEILTTAANEIEASLIVNRLLEQGIHASFVGEYTSSFRAELPGEITVLVARGDLDRAKTALETIESERADIDWSQVDVGKPDEEDA